MSETQVTQPIINGYNSKFTGIEIDNILTTILKNKKRDTKFQNLYHVFYRFFLP